VAGQATYPSPEFPGYPTISLHYADRWSPLRTPTTPLALVRDSGPGAFRANIVMAIARLDPGSTLAPVDEALSRSFAGLPGYVESARGSGELGGWPSSWIDGRFTDPEVGTLVQSVRVVLVEHDGATDAIQLTGTCSAAQADEVLDEIRTILASAVIS